MRIISGKYRGRRLTVPKNLPVRPTTDMNRETLFNILNNYYDFPGLRVLDLFAGTGGVSYEFASRGAEIITAVDQNAGCARFIRQTASELDVPIEVVQGDAFKFLEKSRLEYDVIFADPFYDLAQDDFEKIHRLIFENGLLSAEGMFILEHSKQTSLEHLDHFSFSRKYGSTVFSFFEFEEEEELSNGATE
ncbi:MULTISPECIES: RsmD family RNA methyltransferase [unclassified Flavobacterium]|uniref:RsmD family RNA methyltransferase n=1 Tax=unclassified Flavobacterium TaxID=196869 RepID=UPI001F14692A|nr:MULTISPECIES: RsmD family RNA methyltransferase [unclassified Flavobacterium]UMY65361.1 RsmD family RNA methyltransferase [Flavobacterium sp. HJ-32-4]